VGALSWTGGRSAGVLLHVTSLPGRWGIGTAGDEALAFVDWLAEAGQSVWQILPLVPVSGGGSPYDGLSALAGNPLLIAPEWLVADGLVDAAQAREEEVPEGPVDFPGAHARMERLHRAAHAALTRGVSTAGGRGAFEEMAEGFARFRREEREWAEPYALFAALRRREEGAPWTAWPAALRDRRPEAMEEARRELAREMELELLRQFLFARHWSAVRRRAAARGVRILGDIPIFVSHDSADVWAHRQHFLLDDEGRPEVVAGVPPDYFSEQGQRWGNPLYDWERLRRDGYEWWVRRVRRALDQVDAVRVDHFRGFESYWEIPADAPTAVSGRWLPGPGRDLFDALRAQLGELPLVAEDLGLITPGVEALRDELELPGMRVLQFAFDDSPENPHQPANHVPNAVAYTGTHDNDTLAGWWGELDMEERRRVAAALGLELPADHWALLRTVLASPAGLAIAPAQDLLGLGSEARMNTPGVAEGNWCWRLRPGELTLEVGRRLRETTLEARRAAREVTRPMER
jgi:4-alpha-glucanotransferase